MLDVHTRFKANDEILLISAISMTEITAKKCLLYEGLAKENEVKNFFKQRAMIMKKINDDLRKHLDKVGGA